MPLPCPRCKKRTVELKQYEIKKFAFAQQEAIYSQKVVEAQCGECLWRYADLGEPVLIERDFVMEETFNEDGVPSKNERYAIS